MKYQICGLSHHTASVEVRGRLAFNTDQARLALADLRARFPESEAVVLSTCNRVEIYTAGETPALLPSHQEVAEFLADFHGLRLTDIFDDLFERTGEDVVRHLFHVAASLDSMVVGEPHIVAQIKQAYELACEGAATGPLTNQIFQAALRVAKRVTNETSIGEKRVSIPSVAIADFAKQIFERFDDKHVLVIGAGEMAEETLRYLQDEGARQVRVLNRNWERAEQLAETWHGQAARWDALEGELTAADLVISTTSSPEPIMTRERFRKIEAARYQRPLFILDLAIPPDFERSIGECLGVYLYSIDDLREACARNRAQRDKEWPAAVRIVEQETGRFMADLTHRATGPIIKRLKQGWQLTTQDELRRLLNKLPDLDEREQLEIRQSFDRLINKLLHPPLESLRDEAAQGMPHALIDAFKRLFQLKD